MDAELLSRVQFALTASFHFIFPPLSMGLGLMLVVARRHLPPDEGPEVAPAVVLLGQGLRPDLRAGRRHRDRPGVRVRDELGRLLAVRRQRVRQPARGRGRLRVLPRRWLPGADALRRQPARAAAVAVLDLHGRLRGAFQRALDPDGQLLDADPAGLRDRQQPGRDDRLLGGRVHAVVHPAPAARLGGVVDGRGRADAERQRLVPAQEAPRRAGQVEHARRAAPSSSSSRRPTSSSSGRTWRSR